jgi:hypothetical protein
MKITSKNAKKMSFLLASSIFFILFFSFIVTAISATELQTTAMTGADGTAGLTFNPTGTKLFAIDNNHGSNPDYISEYTLSTAYDLSTMLIFTSFNLTSITPNIMNKSSNLNQSADYGITTAYITRDGSHLYAIYGSSSSDDMNDAGAHSRQYAIMHYTMNTSFDLSTLAFADEYDMGFDGSIAAWNNPGTRGVSFTEPNLRGVYVSDDGSFMSISGGWGATVGSYSNFWTFNMPSPFYTSTMTNYSGSLYIHPFNITTPGKFQYGNYYNLWVSPDRSVVSVIEKDIHSVNTFSTLLGQRSIDNGTLYQILGLNALDREGLTIVNTFTNLYLFETHSGILYKYEVSNLTIVTSEAQNQSQASQQIIEQVINPLLNLFPDHTTLTFGQKMGYVLIVMLISALLLLYAGSQLRSEGLHSLMLYVVIIILIIEFFYFIAIQYIPLGILISLILIATAIIYLAIRGKGGS